MADSIRVFEPGWQARDASGILSGALIDFFLEETTTGDPAYSDAELEDALPNPVVCNSAGFPTSDGNVPVTVWRGTAAYRIRLRRSDGTVVWDFDNQPGATPTTASQNRKYIGECFYYLGSTAPDTSCLVMNGKTIGSLNSGATSRASNSQDTASTYALLWNTFNNTVCPIEDSSGTPTTRGDTAADDFAANKRLPLLDTCGRALIGADNMGGVASKNRLTGLSGGVDGDVPGAAGGAESHTLTEAQLPVVDPDDKKTDSGHVHVVNAPNSKNTNAGTDNSVVTNVWRNNGGGTTENSQSATTGMTFSAIGSGNAHNNVQPSIIVPLVLIYAGAP